MKIILRTLTFDCVIKYLQLLRPTRRDISKPFSFLYLFKISLFLFSWYVKQPKKSIETLLSYMPLFSSYKFILILIYIASSKNISMFHRFGVLISLSILTSEPRHCLKNILHALNLLLNSESIEKTLDFIKPTIFEILDLIKIVLTLYESMINFLILGWKGRGYFTPI